VNPLLIQLRYLSPQTDGRQVSPNMFGPPDRRADLSSLRLWGNEPPHGVEPQILAQARTHCRVASGQQPVRKKGVVVIDGTPARAVTGTVRLPRQADRAGMTFNSLRTLSWPNVGNSLEACESAVSGTQSGISEDRGTGSVPPRIESEGPGAARPMTARRRPHHHQSGRPRPRPATTDDQLKGR
jgi:hypothetical protein